MTAPSTRSSRVRRLVEEYTPDGTIGRLGLAAVTGTVAGFLLWAAVVGVVAGSLLSALLVSPPAAAGAVLFSLVTVLTLWPVYLSAIGRVESPAEYSAEVRGQSPEARLEDAYLRGDLSEAEFERELDAALDDPDRPETTIERDRASRTDRRLGEREREN